MSLDDTYEGLVRFLAHLERFNEELRVSFRDVRQRQEALDGIWNDEARRTCDRALEDLGRSLGHYINTEAETFENFLQQKVYQLGAYLRGS